MDNGFELLLCLIFSLVLGLCWGGLLYWYSPMLGVSVGISLFFLCMLVLLNALSEYEESDTQQNRRFNDA